MPNKNYDIGMIREAFSSLLHTINWECQRGCMPYDWNDYGHPDIVKLCNLLKVNISDGHLLKQDKRQSP